MTTNEKSANSGARFQIANVDVAKHAHDVGEATSGLLEYLVRESEIPGYDAATRIREESLAIIRSCLPPTTKQGRRTGLVCGYVQSGKTMSIETVSALAKDNGYRIVVMLAGVTINLVDQSRGRIEDHLRGGAGEYEWVMRANPSLADRHVLSTLINEWRVSKDSHAGTRVLFVTVMKNAHHLPKLVELLAQFNLAGVPSLIFDDEADQASLNTRPRAPRPSSINEHIESLRKALPSHTFLQYTATPQAPLLISRIDSLSADFATNISAGDGYTGGQTFFNEKPELVRTIPPHEIFARGGLPHEPPESLVHALQLFFVGVAIAYQQEGRPSRNRSMLIHPSQTRDIHGAYYDWVNALKGSWFGTLSNPHDMDRGELLAEFEAAYQQLSTTLVGLPSWSDVAKHLADAINRTEVTRVNTDGREVDWKLAYAHILVGGEKLGRGFTVRGITVTYMPRGPGGWTADTIQQRARFFGYHSRYIGLCRVFLHPDIFDVYRAYLAHEADIREQITSFIGRNLKDLKRAFILNRDLRPTRHNVMRVLYSRPGNTAGWFEQRGPHVSSEATVSNHTLVSALLKHVKVKPLEQYPQHFYSDVSLRDVLENFLVPFNTGHPRDATQMCGLLLAIAQEADSNPAAVCRLIFMDHGDQPRKRTLASAEVKLQQGRSSAGAGRYPGDGAIRQDDMITVQVHRIDIRTSKQGKAKYANVPALAISLPAHVANRLQDVIVQQHN